MSPAWNDVGQGKESSNDLRFSRAQSQRGEAKPVGWKRVLGK